MLSDNIISHIEPISLPKLEWVYLYNNKLTTLQYDILRKSPIKRLLIEGNPLSIDTLHNLFNNIPDLVSVISVDGNQLNKYKERYNHDLSSKISSGILSHKNRYFKLIKSKKSVKDSDGLVVAFAASFGEPEWAGQLSKIKTNVQEYIGKRLYSNANINDYIINIKDK